MSKPEEGYINRFVSCQEQWRGSPSSRWEKLCSQQSVTSTCWAGQHRAGALPAWWTPWDGITCAGKTCISHNGKEVATVAGDCYLGMFVSCSLHFDSHAFCFQYCPDWRTVFPFKALPSWFTNIHDPYSYKEGLGWPKYWHLLLK